ncbi:hypothetical protein E2C01_013025 [Portunus trituberculatus]|uniref:Uncharacterized protein n=1 Tax=Portunus trituberculatus TaxID=210409 RepID=A0A5B7DG91_PORTR|nr:hypothetical protein [Portunus trituberculatus]
MNTDCSGEGVSVFFSQRSVLWGLGGRASRTDWRHELGVNVQRRQSHASRRLTHLGQHAQEVLIERQTPEALDAAWAGHHPGPASEHPQRRQVPVPPENPPRQLGHDRPQRTRWRTGGEWGISVLAKIKGRLLPFKLSRSGLSASWGVSQWVADVPLYTESRWPLCDAAVRLRSGGGVCGAMRCAVWWRDGETQHTEEAASYKCHRMTRQLCGGPEALPPPHLHAECCGLCCCLREAGAH